MIEVNIKENTELVYECACCGHHNIIVGQRTGTDEGVD